MKKQLPIGIDLGTSTSEVAVFENGQPFCIPDQQGRAKSPIVPSIVSSKGRFGLRVGEDTGDPKATVREVKRLMGTDQTVELAGQTYRPEEVSAMILKHMKGIAEVHTGGPVKDVVISVPANFEAAARTSTKHAAEIAGLNAIRLINEPTAAALAFGVRNVDVEAQLVVFDFGGGTLDVSVLEMMQGVLDVQASFGDTRLGGKDIDALLIQWLSEQLTRQHPSAKLTAKAPSLLKSAAEELKVALSRERSTGTTIPFIASSGGEPVDLEVEITRAQFNTMLAPILARTRECLKRALEAGKLRADQIDKVLLVGGTTYIPAVRELVAEFFGRDPQADVPPDLAVAMGAAVHAASAAGELSGEKDIILSDVCPMGLGIDVVSNVGGRFALVYEPLISVNHKIPYMVRKEYHLLTPDQREVHFKLFQDRTGKAVFPEDAIPTGIEGRIMDIPPALYGTPHPLQVEFSYDINGEVAVRASIPGLSKDCNVAFNSSALRMSAEDVEHARNRVSAQSAGSVELWRNHSRAAEVLPLLQKAEDLLARVPPRERSPLIEKVSALKDALATNNESRVSEAKANLVEALFSMED